jgi:acyl transferase domain-containing protein
MQSEYPELFKLNNLPAQKIPGVICYSAAEYQPITLESEVIAHNIAKGLCQELDFPRLVNRVYQDGAKVFIEAGAGGICSRWIDKILSNQEHITVSLNRRGLDDHTSIVKALAKLLSHGVKLDISPLYNLSLATTKINKATWRKVTLGGKFITAEILKAENRQLFQKDTQQNPELHTNYRGYKIINSLKPSYQIQPQDIYPQPEKPEVKTLIDNRFQPQEALKSSELTSTQKPKPKKLLRKIHMNDLKIAQYQKLTNNNSKLTKAHTSFLEARKDFSQQMSEIIKLQLACAQNLLQQER